MYVPWQELQGFEDTARTGERSKRTAIEATADSTRYVARWEIMWLLIDISHFSMFLGDCFKVGFGVLIWF